MPSPSDLQPPSGLTSPTVGGAVTSPPRIVETADVVFLLEPRPLAQLPARIREDLDWIAAQRAGPADQPTTTQTAMLSGGKPRVVLGVNLLFYNRPAPWAVLAKRMSHALCNASALSGGRVSFLIVPHDFRWMRVSRGAKMTRKHATELDVSTTDEVIYTYIQTYICRL